MSNFNNIPTELQQLNQWTVWNYVTIDGKVTKPPRAKVNDSSTWISFKEAVAIVARGEAFGIGFIFSEDDPYAGIDLDYSDDPIITARQHKIFTAFDSYSERSPSGQGLHIVVKGKVPSGARRDKIEVYSSLRYFTFTGDVYHNVPIKNQNDLLNSLWAELTIKSVTTNTTIDKAEQVSDQEIIGMASAAINGDKFIQLGNGEWQTLYKSQSEADFALINIIAFYTQNKSQIKRIFQSSKLGLRDKAKRNSYVDGMIDRSLDRVVPLIDLGEVPSFIKPQSVVSVGETFDIPLPPGLLGEIAQFIYVASPRPVKEIALAGAIGFMAGICGRSYNVSATGLNQYVLLLAGTGTGKEAAASGIGRLMEAVRKEVPSIIDFIGPSEIPSGQGLFKHLSKKSQSFVCILGEFGLRLSQMSNQNGSTYQQDVRRKILDLYNKSGFTDVLHPTTYADSEKDLPAIPSPSFSIFGESTPERFYENINEEMISEGLLPRFLLIEYKGDRVDLNKNHDAVQPSSELCQKLVSIVANSQTVNNLNPRQVIKVKITSEAEALSDKHEVYTTNQINNSEKPVFKHLWNRTHLKALKLAALVAVGVNPYHPVIEMYHLEWAINIVNNDAFILSKRFEKGDVGLNTGEISQFNYLKNVIEIYPTLTFEKAQVYMNKNKQAKIFFDKGIIPYDYIFTKCYPIAAFKNDRRGNKEALRHCLQVMVDKGILQEISIPQMYKEFGCSQKAFKIT